MRTIRIMLAIAIASSLVSCYAQSSKKAEDAEFQILLDKFRTFNPPLNYKKMSGGNIMTKEEAIRFLHKTDDELYRIMVDYNYDTDEITGYYKEEHTAGCSFKYQLNDSIYILCTREIGQTDSIRVYLNSFTLQGERKNRCLVGERFTRDNDWVSFVLLDKTHIRVFYYEKNYERQEEGFLSTVYYVNYEITGDGRFIEKDKSDIIWLKERMIQYSDFNPKMPDDPMGEYDF